MDNAQIAYEFMRRAYDSILQIRAQALERLHKLLLVTVILFSALSYGATQLVAAHAPYSAWSGVTAAVGALAALVLAFAFYFALRLLKSPSTELLSPDKLADIVLKPEFDAMKETDVWRYLAKNTATVYDGLLKRNQAQARQYSCLDACLILGYVLAAIFLASVMMLRFELPKCAASQSTKCTASQSQETSSMAENQPTGSNSPSSQPPANTTQPAPTTQSQPAAPNALTPQDLLDPPKIFIGSRDPSETVTTVLPPRPLKKP